MKLAILAVGSPRDRNLAALIREYETRAARYFRLTTIEVAGAGQGGGSPPAVRAREADHLRARMPTGLDTWALTRSGAGMSSRGLAEALSDMATYGHPGIAFLVGGAYGLDEDLLGECTKSISLSRMTIPHELVRLILAEQIYRAGTILRGEPYHKGG